MPEPTPEPTQMSARSPLHLTIDATRFLLNGQPTNPGTACEGLLMNSRMVQATFDDLNRETHGRWRYPDGTPFDAEENTRRFCAMVPTYADHGLNAVTINLQGGSPQGYSKEQPWHNSAFTATGELRPAYMERTSLVLDTCGDHGIAVILGLFYFGQDHRFDNEDAIRHAVDNAVDWVVKRGDRHVMIEVCNECDNGQNPDGTVNPDRNPYHYDLLAAPRVAELAKRVTERSAGKLLVGVSSGGGRVPHPDVIDASDVVLIHGNGVHDPADLTNLIERTRQSPTYRGQPIVVNEDDHFDFDKATNNMQASIDEGVGWGYFDYRMKDEPHEAGYQSVPTDWGIGHERKRAFFEKLREVTGRGARG
ncbi:MAG: hypothetical protein AAF743_01915 [Planctomycetota bacterium]